MQDPFKLEEIENNCKDCGYTKDMWDNQCGQCGRIIENE